MNKYTMTSKQISDLVKITLWYTNLLNRTGEDTMSDKRLGWMCEILKQKKYDDSSRTFLNQMRGLYLENLDISK